MPIKRNLAREKSRNNQTPTVNYKSESEQIYHSIRHLFSIHSPVWAGYCERILEAIFKNEPVTSLNFDKISLPNLQGMSISHFSTMDSGFTSLQDELKNHDNTMLKKIAKNKILLNQLTTLLHKHANDILSQRYTYLEKMLDQHLATMQIEYNTYGSLVHVHTIHHIAEELGISKALRTHIMPLLQARYYNSDEVADLLKIIMPSFTRQPLHFSARVPLGDEKSKPFQIQDQAVINKLTEQLKGNIQSVYDSTYSNSFALLSKSIYSLSPRKRIIFIIFILIILYFFSGLDSLHIVARILAPIILCLIFLFMLEGSEGSHKKQLLQDMHQQNLQAKFRLSTYLPQPNNQEISNFIEKCISVLTQKGQNKTTLSSTQQPTSFNPIPQNHPSYTVARRAPKSPANNPTKQNQSFSQSAQKEPKGKEPIETPTYPVFQYEGINVYYPFDMRENTNNNFIYNICGQNSFAYMNQRLSNKLNNSQYPEYSKLKKVFLEGRMIHRTQGQSGFKFLSNQQYDFEVKATGIKSRLYGRIVKHTYQNETFTIFHVERVAGHL